MNKEPGPYMLVTDHDTHWYVIPVDREESFHEWLGGPDCEDGEIPPWVDQVGGHPCLVKFDSYTIE